mgnify:CR=1 FL=1
MQVDAVSDGRRVLEADAPHAPSERLSNLVRDVCIDDHLRRIVEHEHGLRDRHRLTIAHERVDGINGGEVAEGTGERKAAEVG